MPTTDVIRIDAASIGSRDGGARLRNIALADPDQPIAVVARRDQEPYVFAALQLGARGCLLDGWPGDVREAAILELSEGGVVITPYQARLVLLALTPAGTGPANRAAELTEAEAWALHALSKGMSLQELSVEAGLPNATVRVWLRGALHKLQRRDRPRGPDLHWTGVPRRPSPGFLTAAAEAVPEDEQ
jgi:two-component system, NarL family, response regulator NreC